MTLRTTSRRALILHGYGAAPTDHWFGWLAAMLSADGIPTTVPALPSPQRPDRRRWEETAQAALGTPDDGTILVAHSLGCLTALRTLSALPGRWRLGTLVLVAGFVDPLPALPELDRFIGGGCEVEGLRDRICRRVVLRSDDDPLVPAVLSDRLAARLVAPVRLVPAAGHFLASDGMLRLPAALEAIIGDRPRPEDPEAPQPGGAGTAGRRRTGTAGGATERAR